MTSELLHPVWVRCTGGSGSEHPLKWHTVCLCECTCVCVPVPLSTVSIVVPAVSQCMFYSKYRCSMCLTSKYICFILHAASAELDTTIITTTTTTIATTTTSTRTTTTWSQIVRHVTVEKICKRCKSWSYFFSTEHTSSTALTGEEGGRVATDFN